MDSRVDLRYARAAAFRPQLCLQYLNRDAAQAQPCCFVAVATWTMGRSELWVQLGTPAQRQASSLSYRHGTPMQGARRRTSLGEVQAPAQGDAGPPTGGRDAAAEAGRGGGGGARLLVKDAPQVQRHPVVRLPCQQHVHHPRRRLPGAPAPCAGLSGHRGRAVAPPGKEPGGSGSARLER